MTKSKASGLIMLLVCTIIWGCAFSFQSIASANIQPFSLIGIRFLMAGVVLTPFTIFYIVKYKVKFNVKYGLLGGFLSGVFLGAASVIQQFGIERTTAGKAGFLTAMYIIFVPMISLVIFKKRSNWKQLFGIIFTVVGVGLMSLKSNLEMNLGDILCLICGVVFSFQIMTVDFFSKRTNNLFLAMISFYTCGIISLVFGLSLETITFEGIKNAIWPIIYLGIGSSGIAYTLQVLGQKRVSGVPASLIMSLEAVFSAIFAMIILKEFMSYMELVGATLMMAGVVVVQVFEDNEKNKQEAYKKLCLF